MRTGEILVRQNTPLRVLHRRSPLMREKTVFSATVQERLDDSHFTLEVRKNNWKTDKMSDSKFKFRVGRRQGRVLGSKNSKL